MAIIPNDEKFIGLSASVDTTERRSALINAESQAYTMQDITDTVSATIPAPVNPTTNYIPFNNGGIFADSALFQGVSSSFKTLNSTNLSVLNLGYNGSQRLSYSDADGSCIIGNSIAVNTDTSAPYSAYGFAANAAYGYLIMGCGISSPYQGIFRANGATGVISIGTAPSTSVGVSTYESALYAGSAIINWYQGPPYYDPYTPNTFMKVVDEAGNRFLIPMWQQIP